MKVSQRHQALHDRAVELSGEYLRKEAEMIRVLEEIQEERAYLFFNAKNLFTYANAILKLPEPTAYTFSAVAKHAAKIPALSKAISGRNLSVFAASRFLSILCEQNAEELIEFAKTHTQRELDFEVARRNPKKKKRSTAKPVNEDTVRLATDIKKTTYENLKRAQALMSKKQFVDFDVVIDKAVGEWLEKHDPIIQADRASDRRPSQSQGQKQNKKAHVPNAENHARNRRDRGQCTYMDEHGNRCTETWWTEGHHIRHRKDGGTNAHTNLTTLCSYHHKMVHQYNLPLEGHISWLKDRSVGYRTNRPLRRSGFSGWRPRRLARLVSNLVT